MTAHSVRRLGGVGVTCLFIAGAIPLDGCTPAPAADAYFPLAAGHQWTYRIQTRLESDSAPRLSERRIDNRGLEEIPGASAWHRRTEQGLDYWLRTDHSGVYRVAHRVPPEVSVTPDVPPRYVLRTPVEVGTQWEALTTLFLLAAKHETRSEADRPPAALMMSYRITAINQEISTPAGHFDRCITVEGQAEVRLWVDTLRQWRNVPIRSAEWYCYLVGLVRQERTETSPSRFMTGGSVLLELTDWN
jgi:hypothetical protein